MSAVTAAPPPRGTVLPPVPGGAVGAGSGNASTFVRAWDPTPVPAPRLLARRTTEERVITTGSVVAGFALAWLVCYRLLPWGSPVGYLVVAFLFTLLLVSVATAIVTPGPAVADRVASVVVSAGALTVGLGLVSTIIFTFVRSGPALIHWNMYVQDMALAGPRDQLDIGGVAHAILGTIIQITIASIITVPLAMGTAVFMTEVGGKFARVVRTVVEAMTALPSVVAGLFIYTVAILMVGLPRSGFAASLALTVMMLPIVARAADVVLRVVPSGLREAGLALGSSRWRTVWNVVLPTARPGLATALILGIARGIGETSPVLLTSGANQFFNANPASGVMNSLPLFIFSTVRTGEPLYIQRAFAAAAILLTLVLILFVTARFLARSRGASR
ncbi:MAG TPA: phosphate ABC transporter permease PstA [Candidatus Limnocylindrales bacterium]